ncbi:MAG: very short patch repair endonuclease [Anaerolineales bacterium]|nr:very short patch repair endonuclease [Anaerolineales bacterium]
MARRNPSFSGLAPASAASSRAKRANRSKDTTHEVLLRKRLWHMGLRYRKNVVSLPGKPDIVFVRAKVAIFCDGDFWHGRDWSTQKLKLYSGSNSMYWIQKIERNMERDQENTSKLENNGWLVLRFWETDIKRSLQECVDQIMGALEERLGTSILSPK